MDDSIRYLHVITAVFDRLGLAAIYALALATLWLAPTTSLSEGTRRFRLVAVAMLIILLTAGIDLVLRTAALADVGLQETWPYIFRVLDHSDYGHFWQWRIDLWWLLVLVALWIYATDWSNRAAMLMLIVVLITFLFESATSHAGENGLWSLANLVNTVHLASMAIWGGAVIVYALFVLPELLRKRDVRRIRTTVLRLSSLATVALVLVILSGLFNTWRQLEQPSDLWTSEYGRILLIKLGLVAIMMTIGALNRFRWVPRVVEHADAPGNAGTAALQRFQQVLRIDSLVFVLIIIAASVLGTTSPPGH